VTSRSESQSVVNFIRDRRSARAGFDARAVDDDLLSDVVKCGLAAPSSKNAQPWRFHVVTEKTALAELADAVSNAVGAPGFVPLDPATGSAHPQWNSTVEESAGILRSAPAAVFIENRAPFSRGRESVASVSRSLRSDALIGYGLELLGHGAALECMWLAAQSLGLGAVFMGDVLVAESVISRRLGIVGDLIGVLVIGYPLADDRPAREVDESLVIWHSRDVP